MHQLKQDRTEEVINRLNQLGTVVVDVETSGLDWRKNHIVGWVITFSPKPEDSYYLPFRHAGGGNIGNAKGPRDAQGWNGRIDHPAEKQIVKLLDRQGNTLVFHNGSFDLRFMWRAGVTGLNFRCEDTIINAPLLDEFQPYFNLEYCCNRAKVQAKKSAEIIAHICSVFPEAAKVPKQAMGHFHRLAGDDLMAVEYARGDGTSTWQLRDWQMKQIAAQDLTLVHDVESRLIPVLARMTARGIRIDEERLGWLEEHVDTEIARLVENFPSGFNVRSPDDVRGWMEQHGCTDWPLTPKGGRPSMTEAWLENHEAGQAVVRVRKFETLKSTFIKPMRETHLWRGRVHTTYNQLRGDQYGTVTGRLSSSEPNLQAVPKHNEELGRLFRSIFVPDEGRTWGSADYSQMEPRLLAFYSRCRVLMEGYRADPPIDAHMAASMGACGPRWEKMTREERKAYRDDIGKRINQTVITGGGKKTLVAKYRIPADEVDKVWADYFRAMPEIRQLQKRAAAKFRQRGYVLSLLRRRARLNDDRDYTAVNRLLQCGNADALKIKMVEIDEHLGREGRPVDLLNNCHDALDFQFEENNREHYRRCLEIMTDFGSGQVIELDVPIVVDRGEGPNWGIATYGEEKKK